MGEAVRPAIVVVDMLKDVLAGKHPIGSEVRNIIPKINALTDFARSRSLPVLFSMDSFLPGDFIFKGKMKEHSIRGTEGAEVMAGLHQGPADFYVPKRRFSAFFKTDLDQTLRLHDVDTVVLTGINTHWCVLTSALDALANDFNAVIVEDCCASYKKEIHDSILNVYRTNPLYPLFRILSLEELMHEMG